MLLNENIKRHHHGIELKDCKNIKRRNKEKEKIGTKKLLLKTDVVFFFFFHLSVVAISTTQI